MDEEDEEEVPKKKKKESSVNMTYIIIGAILIIVFFIFLHLNPKWIEENPLVVLLVVVCIIVYFLSKSLPKFRRDPVEVFKTSFEKDTFDIGYLFDFSEINFDDVIINTDDEDTYRYIFNNPRMNRDMTIVIEYGMGWENVKSVEWDIKLKKKSFEGGGFFNPYGGYGRSSSYRKPNNMPPKKNIPPSMLK